MSLPKVSIVTPSYNQAEFLEACIESVLNQSYQNIEYIVIDGGSTDGSLDILKKYSGRVAFWCSERDEGHYSAVNKGFRRATGSIMTWLNSDDMLFPRAVESVVSVMQALPQVQWISSLRPGFWDFAGFCMEVGHTPGFSREAFLEGRYLPTAHLRPLAWIQQESTFWRRCLWDKATRLNTSLGLASDFDLWARFYEHADLYGVAWPLGGFRTQHEQRSRQIAEYTAEAITSLNAMRKRHGWRPSRIREGVLRFRLDRLPVISRLVLKLLGYEGFRVCNVNPDLPGTHWGVEVERFL